MLLEQSPLILFTLIDVTAFFSVAALPARVSPPAAPATPPGVLLCSRQDQTTMLRPSLQCWAHQGIELAPASAYGEGQSTAPMEDEQKQLYVNLILAQNTGQHCQRQSSFRTALECAMNHSLSCMPPDYRGYLPEPVRMGALVDKLCENISNIDFACAERMMEEVQTCRWNRLVKAFGTTDQVSTVDVTCKGYRFNTECLRAELRPCGCATARLYETLSRDFLYPPACPDSATNQKPTVCDVRNEALFMENGSSVVFSSAFIYFVVFLFVFLCLKCA